MTRRPSLPGADELFRRTDPREPAAADPEAAGAPSGSSDPAAAREGTVHALRPVAEGSAPPSSGTDGARSVRPAARKRGRAADRRPSGRERHEEKITVYVSPEELLDLEQAKLTLRGQHGLAVDRGRIVREAIAMVVGDLEAKGEDSALVRRLRGV
jgi:hypothetical protein